MTRPSGPALTLTVLALLAAGATLGSAAAEGTPRLPFPSGYHAWLHVKSATGKDGDKDFPKFGRIHHIYANAIATRGYETSVFPDGSVLAFDLLEFKTNEDKTITEGSRVRVDVMVKDANRFKDRGGWGFEEFLGDDKTAGSLTADTAAACASCHSSRKEHDSVFSVVGLQK